MLNAGDTSSAGAGSAVSILAGRSEALGGSVLVAAETGDLDEGDVILPAGSGEAGASHRIALLDGEGSGRITVDSEGGVDASSAAGQHLTLSSGADVLIQSSGATGETLIGASAQEQEEGSSDTVSLRVRDDRIISNAPAQLADVRTPVDSRIIHAGEGESGTDAVSVDEDEVLQRVMEVPVRSFSYTEEWRQIQSMGEEAVHGIIGQEVADMMPEWVSVMEELSFPEQGFALQQFYELKDRRVLMDTLVSLQAQHRRMKLGPNSETSSGRLDINTANAGSYGGADGAGLGASGNITVATGSIG